MPQQETEGNRIRFSVMVFAAFCATSLYQSPGIGSNLAFVLIILIMITSLLSGDVYLRKFSMPFESRALVLFLLIVSVVSVIKVGIPSSYYKFAGQLILCIWLTNIRISKKEHELIRWAFIISGVFYSAVVIQTCAFLGSSRYVHGDIMLFGATLDPNYIGIPLVAAMALLLDNILRNKRRILSMAGYLIIAIAVIYTASRGNFLAMLIGGILILYFYFRDRDIRLANRVILIVLVLVAAFMLVNMLSENFSEQWLRMTSTFDEGSDNGRFELWEQSLNLWKGSPVFGVGLRGMYTAFGMASHNTTIQVLTETGIIGAVLFIAFIVNLLKKSFRYDKAMLSVLIAMLVHVFFLDALDNRAVWVILCWIVMLPQEQEYDLYQTLDS